MYPKPLPRFILIGRQMWIGIAFGGILTAYLMAYRFRLAIVIGIATVSIISWP
jgi:AGZA family xanthine/uracil permease-like MFS transporter